jgi:membrane protease YdiL (CAAX protease family)
VSGIVSSREPIGPWWQTVLILVVPAAVSIASCYQHGFANLRLPGMSSKLSGYVTVIAAEWLVVLLVWLALRSRGRTIGDLVSGRWPTVGALLKDLGIAIVFMVTAIALVTVLIRLIGGGAAQNAGVLAIIPKTPLELSVFLVLAVTGSFSEELLFRGYLSQQFFAWTGSHPVAIIAQGALFGLAHGYYGRTMFAIAVQGCLLGWLAYWRQSLRAGILAHVLQDVIGGLVAFFTT